MRARIRRKRTTQPQRAAHTRFCAHALQRRAARDPPPRRYAAAFQADDGYEEPHVIAEIGCNHMGQFEIAKELLTLAKNAGATVGKFQKRCPKELLTEEQYNAQHPNPHNSYGDTYGAHREFLERTSSIDLLQKHSEEIGLLYSCSVWDTTSAKEIASLNPAVDQSRLAVCTGRCRKCSRRVQRHGPHLDGHDDEGRSGEDRELLGAG